MGNTVPKAGFKPTSLAFRASVLPLHHIGSLMSPLYPRLPVYAAPCLRGQCNPPGIVSLLILTITYIQAMALHINIQRVGSTTTQGMACTGSWSWHQCCGWDENGKYCAQSRTQTHISGQCAIIIPHRLPDVIIIPTHTCVRGSLPHTTTLFKISKFWNYGRTVPIAIDFLR